MDVATGTLCIFRDYTPEHPEFVARVIVRGGNGRTTGVRPFELERFKLVKRAPATKVESASSPRPKGELISSPWDTGPKPKAKAAPKRPDPTPHIVTRARKINLDA